MADFPALPLWTDAYLADTRHLSTLEHGAYLLLLIEAWRRPSCSLPDDDTLLSRLAALSMKEWLNVKPQVMALWFHNGRTKSWTQKRLLKERQFVEEKRAKNRDAALTRWKETKKDDANAMPNPMHEACVNDAPTPTPTPTKKKKGKTNMNGTDLFPSDVNTGDAIQTAFAMFNKVAKDHGLPSAQKLTETRRASLRLRLKQCDGLEGWANVLRVVDQCAWMHGNNKFGWRVDIGWLLKEDNIQRILEGSISPATARNGSLINAAITQYRRANHV